MEIGGWKVSEPTEIKDGWKISKPKTIVKSGWEVSQPEIPEVPSPVEQYRKFGLPPTGEIQPAPQTIPAVDNNLPSGNLPSSISQEEYLKLTPRQQFEHNMQLIREEKKLKQVPQAITPKIGGITIPQIPDETSLEFQGVTNQLKNLYEIYKISKKPAEMVREGGQIYGDAINRLTQVDDVRNRTTLAGAMLRQLPAEATGILFDYASMYIEPETLISSGIFKAGLKIPAVRNILTKRIDLLEKTIVGNVPKEEMSNVVGRPMAEGEFEQIIKDLPLWKKQVLFQTMVEKGDPIVAVRTERPFVQKIRDIIGIKQILPEVAAARPPEVVGVRTPEPIKPPLGLPEGQIMRAPAPVTPAQPIVAAPTVIPPVTEPITPTAPKIQAETPLPAPISPKTGIIPQEPVKPVTTTPAIPPELEPLAQEARKYKTADEFVNVNNAVDENAKNVYWHGSASGDLRGGRTGLHLGTKKAATQALEARIGIPADGKGWTGDREYGKTLLAGKKTLRKLDPNGNNETGFNVDVPEEDFYAKDYFEIKPNEKLKYADGSEMPMNVKPIVEPFRIKGKMTNSPLNPHDDWKANGYMAAQIKKGNAKSGYFYKNISEDEGSISVVVPNGSHLEKVNTKSQLTDIWNKAHAQPAPVEAVKPIETKPEIDGLTTYGKEIKEIARKIKNKEMSLNDVKIGDLEGVAHDMGLPTSMNKEWNTIKNTLWTELKKIGYKADEIQTMMVGDAYKIIKQSLPTSIPVEAVKPIETKPAIPAELEPLAQEARKYKTAEEFAIKELGIPVIYKNIENSGLAKMSDGTYQIRIPNKLKDNQLKIEEDIWHEIGHLVDEAQHIGGRKLSNLGALSSFGKHSINNKTLKDSANYIVNNKEKIDYIYRVIQQGKRYDFRSPEDIEKSDLPENYKKQYIYGYEKGLIKLNDYLAQDSELFANGLSQYMTNPNKMKKEAPLLFGMYKKVISEHPKFQNFYIKSATDIIPTIQPTPVEAVKPVITPAPTTVTPATAQPPEQAIKQTISDQITDIMRTSKSMMEAHNRIKTELNMDLSIADLKQYEPMFKGGLPPDMSDGIIKDLSNKIKTKIAGNTLDYGVDEIFSISTPEIMDSITTFEKVKQWAFDRIKNAKEALHNVEMSQNYLSAYPDSLPIAEGVIDNTMKMTRLLTDLQTMELAIDKATNKQAIADMLISADRSEREGADKVENVITTVNKLIEQGKLNQKDKDSIVAFGQIRKVIKNQIIDEILNSRSGIRIKSEGIKYQVKYTIKSGQESTRNWVSEYVYENLKKKYPDLQILGQKEQVIIKHRDPNTGKYVIRKELVNDYDEALEIMGKEQKQLIKEILPYFNWIPHNRIAGKMWVEVYEPLAAGGEQKIFSARVPDGMIAKKMETAIKQKMPSAKIVIKPHNEKMKYMPSFGSMAEVQLFLNQTGIDPTSEPGQRIINAYRSMSGLMSSLIHAQNIAGYRVDYDGISESIIMKAKQAIYRGYRQDIKELYPNPDTIKDDFRFNVAKKYIDALSGITEKSPMLDGIKGLSYFWILANKPTYVLQNFTEMAWGLARLPKLNKPLSFWLPLSKEYTPLIDLAYKNGVLKPFFGEQMVGKGLLNQLNILGNVSETWSSKKIFGLGLRVARDKGLTGQEAYRQAYQYMFVGKPFYNNANTLIGLLGKESGWVNRYGFIFLRWTLDWMNKFARGNTKTKLLTILATILMVGIGGLPFGRKLLSKFNMVNIKKNPRMLSITDRFLLAGIPGALGVDPTFLNPVFYGYKGLGEIGGNVLRGLQITSSQIERANIDYKKYGIIGAIGHLPLIGIQYPLLGMKKAAGGVVEVREKQKKIIYTPTTAREKFITGAGLTTFELGQLYQQKREK